MDEFMKEELNMNWNLTETWTILKFLELPTVVVLPSVVVLIWFYEYQFEHFLDKLSIIG